MSSALSIRTLIVVCLSVLLVIVSGAPAPEIATKSRIVVNCNQCLAPYNQCRNRIFHTCAYQKHGKWIDTFVLLKGRWVRKCPINIVKQKFYNCDVQLHNCVSICRQAFAYQALRASYPRINTGVGAIALHSGNTALEGTGN